jgi:hypothetical protein
MAINDTSGKNHKPNNNEALCTGLNDVNLKVKPQVRKWRENVIKTPTTLLVTVDA